MRTRYRVSLQVDDDGYHCQVAPIGDDREAGLVELYFDAADRAAALARLVEVAEALGAAARRGEVERGRLTCPPGPTMIVPGTPF